MQLRSLWRMQVNWTGRIFQRGILCFRSQMLWGRQLRDLSSWVEFKGSWIQDIVGCVHDVLNLIWPRMVMLSEEVLEVTWDLVMKAQFDCFQVKNLKPKIIHMPILD